MNWNESIFWTENIFWHDGIGWALAGLGAVLGLWLLVRAVAGGKGDRQPPLAGGEGDGQLFAGDTKGDRHLFEDEKEPVPEPVPEAPPPPAPRLSAFERLRRGLSKTRSRFFGTILNVLASMKGLDEDALEEIEEALIGADVGVKTGTALVASLREAWEKGDVRDGDAMRDFLRNRLRDVLAGGGVDLAEAPQAPTVVLVCGVNGVGKTTSIAKLACLLRNRGKKVLLAAGDTFRAAAVDQLSIWAERVGAGIVRHQSGADPAAVVFDAVDAALARKVDYLIVDTAGRLHTAENLMRELNKIRSVIQRKIPDAPHEVLLVLDATTGQNAIAQAREFEQAVAVTGLFLAKLDGTAKGGVVVAIKDQLDIPVKFIGVGESMEDVEAFDPDRFVDALLSTEEAALRR